MHDRDAALVAERPEPLAHDRRADRRVLVEHRGDPIGERVDLRARRRPDVAGRLGAAEQPVDGVAAHAQPAGDGRLGHPLAMEEPMNLGPVLHLMHSFLPRPRAPLARGCQSRPGWVLRFRPAGSAQYSGGVDTRVSLKDDWVKAVIHARTGFYDAGRLFRFAEERLRLPVGALMAEYGGFLGRELPRSLVGAGRVLP